MGPRLRHEEPQEGAERVLRNVHLFESSISLNWGKTTHLSTTLSMQYLGFMQSKIIE